MRRSGARLSASCTSHEMSSSDFPEPVVPANRACGPSATRSARTGPCAPTPSTADSAGAPRAGERVCSSHRARSSWASRSSMTALRGTTSGTPSTRDDDPGGSVIRERLRCRTASHQVGEYDGAPAGAGRVLSAWGGTSSWEQVTICALRGWACGPQVRRSPSRSPAAFHPSLCALSRWPARSCCGTPGGSSSTFTRTSLRARSWAHHQRSALPEPLPTRARLSPSQSVRTQRRRRAALHAARTS